MTMTRRLSSSSLLKNVMAVASGTAAGQVVVLAFSPLITRIYSPETFGLQGVFLSLISILSPAIALRYPMAIVVASDEAEAARLSRLAVMIAFGLSILLGFVLLFADTQILTLLGAEALGAMIWFLPLALFCVALQDVADFRAARLGSFRLVAIVTVVQAFLTNLARVLGGLAAPVAGTLVAVTAIAPAVQSALLTFGNRRRRTPVPPMDPGEALTLLRRHRDFPLYRVPTDMMNAFAQVAPVLALSVLFSPAAAGLYALARSVVNLPLNVIGGAVGSVYYSRLAEMSREGKPLLPTVLRATLAQFLVPGGALLLVSFAFPAIFALMFGEAWRPAGEFARWMALWVLGMLANIPSVRALPVIRAQWVHLVFNGIILSGGLTGMMVGYWTQGTPIGAVAGYSIATAALYALQILTYLLVIARHDRNR